MSEKVFSVKELINYYNLERIPVEGTLLKRIYTSEEKTASNIPCSSAMIGLFSDEIGSYSNLHKLSIDELWIFLEGDPIELFLLNEDRTSSEITLGKDISCGQKRFFLVKAGTWQAGKSLGDYSLFTCHVTPGFTNTSFVGGSKELIKRYPDVKEKIMRYLPKEQHLPKDYNG